MTVRKHIINFIKWVVENNITVVDTSQIHTLSGRGKQKFGRILGSPSTYERCFRQMRHDKEIDCKEVKLHNKRESSWMIKGVNL